MFGSLHVVVEYLHNESLGAYILADLRIYNLLLAVTLIDSLLHHTRADGSHLGTVFRIHNRCHDVTTEGGTNLIEQVLVNLIILLVLEVANLQFRAVGSQTRGQ